MMSDCSFRRIFNLKQITPMVHFQYNEDGATIRATELKPKFDRFIKSVAVARDVDRILLKNKEVISNASYLCKTLEEIKDSKSDYFLKDMQALKYKVTINANAESNQSHQMVIRERKGSKNREQTIGAYFEINEGTEKSKDSSFYGDIQVCFTCFDKRLLEVISGLFPLFIAVTSFGFRQDKGYGNFICIDDLIKQKIQGIRIVRELFKDRYVLYKVKDLKSTSYRQALIKINKLNQMLKSGINGSRSYIEVHGNISEFLNEKEAMKRAINNTGKLKAGEVDSRNKPVRYFRGLFGFADHYEFRHIQIESKPDEKITIDFQVKNEYISRFASPLTYIVEEKCRSVYVLLDKYSLKKIQEAEEKVRKVKFIAQPLKNKKKKKKDDVAQKNEIAEAVAHIEEVVAYVPTKEEFDVEYFFKTLTEKGILENI